MKINRREFIQITGATAAGLAVSGLGFDLRPVKVQAQMLKTQYAKETLSICPYCAVGCGVIVHTSRKGDGRVINIEGDPDHVINRGSLCSKGASLTQLVENENRITEPMYRAPHSQIWEKVSWDWALTEIAKRVKATRDATFESKNAPSKTSPKSRSSRWRKSSPRSARSGRRSSPTKANKPTAPRHQFSFKTRLRPGLLLSPIRGIDSDQGEIEVAIALSLCASVRPSIMSATINSGG